MKADLLKYIFFPGLLAVITADFFIHRHHEYFPWDSVPAFSAAFALSSVIAIIFFSRILGKMGIQRKDTYYD